ncbi:hypothetical protein WMY93_013734 [Mugilogobius chulae]|uniref:GDNF/GAS1 domain-containing protein n=1 Tax=Mugilogobius chulae TaxID=88201 RepID=A0AAW0P2G9_9GOBI
MRWWCRAVALLPWVLVALDAQLICWQALLRCHEEPECELAYSQYLVACEGNLRGTKQQCPSHCISALIRLNHTRSGPDLESCDCAQDAECVKAKKAIEPCLPRRHPSDAGGIGCMEARQRCEEDSSCHTSLTAYLSYCGQLFNGRSAPPNNVISDQPDVEDIYEDEDYDPRNDREDVYLDYSSATHSLPSSCTLDHVGIWLKTLEHSIKAFLLDKGNDFLQSRATFPSKKHSDLAWCMKFDFIKTLDKHWTRPGCLLCSPFGWAGYC